MPEIVSSGGNAFQLFDDFRHSWAIIRIMSPHPFEEVNNVWTPLFPQARDRWSECLSSVCDTIRLQGDNLPLAFRSNDIINSMLVHSLEDDLVLRQEENDNILTSQGNFLLGMCHCNISQYTMAHEKTSTL